MSDDSTIRETYPPLPRSGGSTNKEMSEAVVGMVASQHAAAVQHESEFRARQYARRLQTRGLAAMTPNTTFEQQHLLICACLNAPERLEQVRRLFGGYTVDVLSSVESQKELHDLIGCGENLQDTIEGKSQKLPDSMSNYPELDEYKQAGWLG